MLADSVYDLKGELLPRGALVTSFLSSLEQLAGANKRHNVSYSYNPIDMELGPEIKRQKHLLFQILMAQARFFDIEFVSISSRDLIAPKIKTRESFNANFTWEFVRHVDMPGSCGNGYGRQNAQYQISGDRFFNPEFRGIFDPKTEKRIYQQPFELSTKHPLDADALSKAIREDKIAEYVG